MTSNPTALVILDGFGYSPEHTYNAMYHAHTPFLDYLLQQYPHTLLQASGQAVGLLPGIAGNSEVGHLIIGSGRIIKQDAMRIAESMHDGSLMYNRTLHTALQQLASKQKRLHLIGLLSDGRVHSDEHFVYTMLALAKQYNLTVYIHPFLDGRDVPPKSAAIYLQALAHYCTQKQVGAIGSMHGRFYAMDRDKQWERTQKSYTTLTQQQGVTFNTWNAALASYYQQGITDEFIPPTQLDNASIVQPEDGILFFNYRADRARQLTELFFNSDLQNNNKPCMPLTCFLTLTDYQQHLSGVEALFPAQSIKHTLKDVLAMHGKSIFSIAETEKYAHVTYFFNGGNEILFPQETRVLVPSVHARNYIQHPRMSAAAITDAVVASLVQAPSDFYLINYANADMVGHSGNFEATVKAVECLDEELQRLYETCVQELNGTLYITADHGNAESMFDVQAQQPKTAHTANPVPFIMVKRDLHIPHTFSGLQGLADIAPFMVQQMGIPIPLEMSGSVGQYITLLDDQKNVHINKM